MPQPRVIIPGFRIGTLNGDAFSLVRARARLVETSRNYIIANFPNATKRVSLPITGLMTRKRTEPFPTGSSFHLLPFFPLSFFSFSPSTPHFFNSARFPTALSPSRRCGVTLPFRLLISPSGRFDRVNTGWNIGETGAGGVGGHVYAGERVTQKGSLYWRRFSFEVVNCNSLRI